MALSHQLNSAPHSKTGAHADPTVFVGDADVEVGAADVGVCVGIGEGADMEKSVAAWDVVVAAAGVGIVVPTAAREHCGKGQWPLAPCAAHQAT